MLGEIDGSGRITLVDPIAPPEAPTPVDLDLEKVTFHPPGATACDCFCKRGSCRPAWTLCA